MGLIRVRLRTNVQPLGRSVRAMSLISRNSGLSAMSASSYRQSLTSGRSNRITRTPGAAVSTSRFPLTLIRIVTLLRQRGMRAPADELPARGSLDPPLHAHDSDIILEVLSPAVFGGACNQSAHHVVQGQAGVRCQFPLESASSKC